MDLSLVSSLLSLLSFLLKAPLVPKGAPVVNALFAQRQCITNLLRACVGLAPENPLALEHRHPVDLLALGARGIGADHAQLLLLAVARLTLEPDLVRLLAQREAPVGFDPPPPAERLWWRLLLLGGAPFLFACIGLRRTRGDA